MNQAQLFLSASLLTLLSAPALAGAGHYGKVIDVDPVYRDVERRIPHRQCWQEPVTERSYRSATGPILGAIVGGALGNELGHKKSNKQVGAVVGAVLGASVGRDIGQRHRKEPVSYRERCQTVHDVAWQQEVVAYDVTYRFRGERYHTRLPYHPGKRIPLRVEVAPLEDYRGVGKRHYHDRHYYP